MDVVKAMPQFAWPAFTQRRCDLHLVVAHAPAGVCEDPAAFMKLLIERLQPEGDFALSCEGAGSETTLFCAFEQASDASVIIDALCGHEDNRHPGWASEFHCSVDKATVDAIGRKPLP
jgi:hypothetical protein